MALFIKLIFVVVAIGFWLGTQKLLGLRKPPADGLIGDQILKLLAPWHSKIAKNSRLANFLLISSSLVIDVLGLFLIAQSIFGPSLRPLLAMIMLFGLRQINQVITNLPTPPGMIWRDPGFPSLFVTYGVSNDLFFSGHSALAVLGALELFALGGAYFSILAILVIIFEIGTVLLLRAHWSMDIFAGIVTALWVHEVALRWAPAMDIWVGGF